MKVERHMLEVRRVVTCDVGGSVPADLSGALVRVRASGREEDGPKLRAAQRRLADVARERGAAHVTTDPPDLERSAVPAGTGVESAATGWRQMEPEDAARVWLQRNPVGPGVSDRVLAELLERVRSARAARE